jgi:hypothetical protein
VRKALSCVAASTSARRWRKGPNPGRSQAERPLVAGFCP